MATYKGGPSGMTYLSHADWQGTERARTGMSGTQPVETCTSLPFGDAMNCTGTNVSPIHYTGKERDSETDNDYVGARYYASGYGRFTSTDTPFVEAKRFRDTQSWNLYEYARNNSLKHVDPDGVSIKPICHEEKNSTQVTCSPSVVWCPPSY